MLLITPNEVIEIAFADAKTLKPEMIRPSKIDIAQERFLRPVLGNLYDSLIDGNHTLFIDEYIKPPLAYFVRHAVISDLAMSVDGSGVGLHTLRESVGEVEKTANSVETSTSKKSSSDDATISETQKRTNADESSESRKTSGQNSSTDTTKGQIDKDNHGISTVTINNKRDTNTNTNTIENGSITSTVNDKTVANSSKDDTTTSVQTGAENTKKVDDHTKTDNNRRNEIIIDAKTVSDTETTNKTGNGSSTVNETTPSGTARQVLSSEDDTSLIKLIKSGSSQRDGDNQVTEVNTSTGKNTITDDSTSTKNITDTTSGSSVENSTRDVKDSKTTLSDNERITTDKVVGNETRQTESSDTGSVSETKTRTLSGTESEDLTIAKTAENILSGTNTKQTSASAIEDGHRQANADKTDTGRTTMTVTSVQWASKSDREMIRRQALADANILLAKAVRYVEHNRNMFPEYEARHSPVVALGIRGGFVL